MKWIISDLQIIAITPSVTIICFVKAISLECSNCSEKLLLLLFYLDTNYNSWGSVEFQLRKRLQFLRRAFSLINDWCWVSWIIGAGATARQRAGWASHAINPAIQCLCSLSASRFLLSVSSLISSHDGPWSGHASWNKHLSSPIFFIMVFYHRNRKPKPFFPVIRHWQ